MPGQTPDQEDFSLWRKVCGLFLVFPRDLALGIGCPAHHPTWSATGGRHKNSWGSRGGLCGHSLSRSLAPLCLVGTTASRSVWSLTSGPTPEKVLCKKTLVKPSADTEGKHQI